MIYLRRALLTLSLLGGLFLLALVVANLSDEALDSDAAQIVSDPPIVTEKGTLAFYYLLGLRAREKSDPQRRGQEIWDKAMSVPVDQEQAILNQALQDRVWPRPEELKHASGPLTNYIRLLEYGEYTPLKPRRPFSLTTGAPLFLHGHQLLAAHVGELVTQGQWQEAKRLIRLENHFQEKFFIHGYLLDATIAHLILYENARFLVERVKANPRLTVDRETKASFQFPEPRQLMSSALHNELRHFSSAVQSIPPMELAWMVYGLPEWMKGLPLGDTLRPNETVNRYLLFLRETLSIQCPQGGNGCFASVQWAAPSNPLAWLRNPMGRLMFQAYASSMEQRTKKNQQRDELLRALLSQL